MIEWKRLAGLVFLIGLLSGGAEAKERVAFLAGFSSGSPSIALTDINFEKGLKTFLEIYPAANRSLDFIKFDNQGEAANTAFEIQKINSKGIRFIVGLSKSNQALVATSLAEQLKLLFITPFATDGRITRAHPYSFRTCFSNRTQAEVMAHFSLSQLQAKKILVLVNADSPYSVELGTIYSKTINSQIAVTEIRYLPDPLDAEPIRKAVTEGKPDTIFIPDYVGTATSLVKMIYSINPSIRFVGTDGWGGREVLDPALLPLSKLESYYSTAWSEEIKTAENAKFISTFTRIYGKPPVSVGPAVMYDGASVFWQAYQKAQGPKTPETLRTVLLTQKFKTLAGAIAYPDPVDTTPQKPVVIIRVSGGKHEFFKTY